MMDPISGFFVYATVFRLAVVAAGVVCIVLGHGLFLKGVWSPLRTGVEAAQGGFRLSLKNALPGTCFALFGAALLVAMVVQTSPELDLRNLPSRNPQSLPPLAGPGPFTSGPRLAGQPTTKLRGESSSPIDADGSAGDQPGSATDEAIQKFEALVERGRERERQGNAAEALKAYEAALAVPGIPWERIGAAVNQLAWIQQQQGRLDEALRLARIAVRARSDDPASLDTLAVVLLKRNEVNEALSWARRAVGLAPDDPHLLHTLALALEATGDAEQASATMQRAARLDPRFRGEADRLRQALR